MILLIVAIAVIVGGLFYLLKKKGLSLTQAEQQIVSGIVSKEQAALNLFTVGKEDVLAEYNRLKLRVKNAIGLQAKLPMPNAAPAIVSPAVPIPMSAPVPVAAPQLVEDTPLPVPILPPIV